MADHPGESSTPESDERVASSTIAIYAAPVGAVFFSSFLISSFFINFATDVLLIAPAMAGTVLFLGQFWDALNDPPIGHLSDRTRTRFGRRRPWFVASAIPLALCTYALWAPPDWLTGSYLVAWTLVVFLLYRTFYSTFRVPHLALGAELARGYHDRTRVFAGSQFIESIGLLGAAATIGLVENADKPREMMADIAVWMALAIIFAIFIASAFIRERKDYQRADPANSYAVFAEVLRNPHARQLLVIFLIDQVILTLVLGSLPFVSKWLLKTPGNTALLMGTSVVSLMLSIPAWTLLSRRFGKRQVWLASKLIRAAVLLNIWALGEGDVPFILVGCFIVGCTASCGTVVGPSLKADVIDWDEAKSGARREGAYFATWNFAQKTAGALGGWLLGVSLAFWGYDASLAEQSDTTIFGIRSATGYLPAALSLASALALWRFKLGEQEHADAVAGIRER